MLKSQKLHVSVYLRWNIPQNAEIMGNQIVGNLKLRMVPHNNGSSMKLQKTGRYTKVGVLRASHKIFLSLRVKFE
jgi:hypothetical protein